MYHIYNLFKKFFFCFILMVLTEVLEAKYLVVTPKLLSNFLSFIFFLYVHCMTHYIDEPEITRDYKYKKIKKQ